MQPPPIDVTAKRCNWPAEYCKCVRCLTDRNDTEGLRAFIVCPKCGNKRCPHSDWHNNACTNSNEPGQKGSRYEASADGGTPAQRTATETGDPRYLALLADMAALHRRKAADYGRGEDPLANIRASAEIGVPAWQGAFLRALDKVHRIKSYCLTGKLANEGVEDSMADLMAYAGIMLVLFREDRERLVNEMGDPH